MYARKNPRSAIFITGTDKGVSKTYVGVRLTRALALYLDRVLVSRGPWVFPCKPVESDCERVDGRLVPHDAHAPKSAAGRLIGVHGVCP